MKPRQIHALVDIDDLVKVNDKWVLKSKNRLFKPVMKIPEKGSIKDLKEVQEYRKFLRGE